MTPAGRVPGAEPGRLTAQDFLRGIPLGTRVVARHLLADGRATDALGVLVERDADAVVIDTRRGAERVALGAVIAAKQVPPPPPPRSPRL